MKSESRGQNTDPDPKKNCPKPSVLHSAGWSSGNPFRLEIGLEGGRNEQAAVSLLAGLHQSNEQPGQSRAATVEQVWKSILAGLGLEPQVHASGLKIFAV